MDMTCHMHVSVGVWVLCIFSSTNRADLLDRLDQPPSWCSVGYRTMVGRGWMDGFPVASCRNYLFSTKLAFALLAHGPHGGRGVLQIRISDVRLRTDPPDWRHWLLLPVARHCSNVETHCGVS